MSETRLRLTELCGKHAIDTQLVDQSRDLVQVLDRALAECERWVVGDDSSPDDRIRQLAGLVQLARTTRLLQSGGASLDDSDRAVQDLERVDRELAVAQADSERLQQSLDDTMAELDRATVQPVDIELLRELFGTIGRLCHKINNPLTSIMGRAQMMQLKLQGDADPQLAKSVGVIEESSKRVAALVQELANVICQGRKQFTESYDSKSGSR